MLRRLFYALIIGVAVVYVSRHFDELKLLIQTLWQGDHRWILMAVLAQFVWLIVLSANLLACYRLMGVHEQLGRIFTLVTASNFMSVIAPSLGAGTLAVLLADARQRGKAAGRVTTASYLYVMFDYIGLMVVMSIGMVILSRHGLLSTFIIGGAAFILIVGFGMITLTIVGIRSAEQLQQAVQWLVRRLNRMLKPLVRRTLIDPEKAAGFATDIAEGLTEIRRAPWGLLIPFFLALTRKSMMIVILYFASLAFATPFNLPTLIVSFMVSYLFTIASVTPAGVGFVEGAMAIIQTGMGINPVSSAAVIIAYRGVTFWLVFLYGFVAFRRIGSTTPDPNTI
ncbi:MAG: flippase-like domain-containing protein [Anaerolineales bacterium]|nr:MAG: flippase-like domain-containing protein [Anaerolineales bacterium]